MPSARKVTVSLSTFSVRKSFMYSSLWIRILFFILFVILNFFLYAANKLFLTPYKTRVFFKVFNVFLFNLALTTKYVEVAVSGVEQH